MNKIIEGMVVRHKELHHVLGPGKVLSTGVGSAKVVFLLSSPTAIIPVSSLESIKITEDIRENCIELFEKGIDP